MEEREKRWLVEIWWERKGIMVILDKYRIDERAILGMYLKSISNISTQCWKSGRNLLYNIV